MSTTVHVEGIAGQTTENEVRDFFSFCGKIKNLSIKPTSSDEKSPKSATVTFEKETAAKTALLLDNTQLGPAQVHVKSAASLDELGSTSKSEDPESEKDNGVAQEDKPRSRIVAEYLAHGYVISDNIIERALALDQQHGVSARFTKTLQDFNQKYKATERAKAADDRYAVTKSASAAWNSLNSYFDKAINTPTGQRLRQFYEAGNKQVIDVHNEARHLADLKSGKSATPPQQASGEGASGGSSAPAGSESVSAPEPSQDTLEAEKKG